MMTQTRRTLSLPGVGTVDVTLDDRGEGQPFMLLHGGGGPDTVAGFADLFAASHEVRVLSPIHPGFGGNPRPEELDTIGGLAALYVALIEDLDLSDVTVIGNSIGGWIAAEMALLESPRISGVILVDAVGIEVPGHPVADFFALTLEQVQTLGFHDPAPFRVDPASLPPAAQATAAANRVALSVYAARMSDPTLLERLSRLEIPTLVLWGDSDGIVDPDYGRAYAAAIPMARFQLLADAGHLPQIETPAQLLDAIWNCAETDFSRFAV
jgi:pimeloyl-ACP methyl ester carboxylesterase